MAMTKKHLISEINEILRRHQFYGNGTPWNREYPGFIDVVDLQISKSKDMFTINVGVADKFVLHSCWNIDAETLVDEQSCTVRARLGELLYGKDVWWNLPDHESIKEAVSAIQAVAVPFFQFHHNIDHMIETLEKDPASARYPPGVIYLALLHYQKGDSDRCREIFKSIKLTDAWRKKASEILDALR
jgi:hypothetical protein